MTSDVCIIIVNYKTLHLTRQVVSDCRTWYPHIPLVLVDNASGDESTEFCRSCGASRVILNATNIGHGPAMDQAIRMTEVPYVFTLDTDCRIIRGGFLEEMILALSIPAAPVPLQQPYKYAIGWRRWVNANGVSIGPKKRPEPGKHIPYIHPSAGLYRRDIYLTLPPFNYDGAPCNQNMRAAFFQGYPVYDFPIRDYVQHLIAGTRRMYDGRWNPKDHEDPGRWDKDVRYPI